MSARKRCVEWLKSIESSLPHDAASPQDSFLEQPLHKRARMANNETTPRRSKAKRIRSANADVHADVDEDDIFPDDELRSQTSSKRSRNSENPTKASSSVARQTNRLKAEGKYDEKLMSDLDHTALPESLVQLQSDLKRLADGTGTLPSSLRSRLESTGDINTSRVDLFYDDQSNMYALWERIQDIVKQAKRCRLRRDYEAGWNSAVHHPLLNLACQLSSYDDHVWAVNISDVRPQKGLLPFDQEIRKKMVDFGLVINTQASNGKLANFYHSHSFPQPQDRDSLKTWNHTEGQLIAEHPLVVSIETKRQADKDDEAQLQLGTWASAHIKRLVELRNPISSQETASIFLPQIKIQGAHFTFLLVRGDYDGAKDSLKVVLYTGKMMGDVTDYDGFFRVLACIRRIVTWIYLSYIPWLQDWTGAD